MQNGAYVGLSPKSYFAFDKKDGKVDDKKGAKGKILSDYRLK